MIHFEPETWGPGMAVMCPYCRERPATHWLRAERPDSGATFTWEVACDDERCNAAAVRWLRICIENIRRSSAAAAAQQQQERLG